MNFNIKEKRIEIIYTIFAVIGLILYGLVINRKAYNSYKNKGTFTICVIDEVTAMKGGKICKYKYYVNDKEYIKTNYIYPYKPKEGEYYYMIYINDDPDESRIILGYIINNDSIKKKMFGKNIKKLPIFVNEKLLEEAIN